MVSDKKSNIVCAAAGAMAAPMLLASLMPISVIFPIHTSVITGIFSEELFSLEFFIFTLFSSITID